jgi:putative ATPase
LLEAAVLRGDPSSNTPLADRMRPRALDELVGQEHLLAEHEILRAVIEQDHVPSMILWGPPGSGKTSLAHVISRLTRSAFEPFSAVLGGVPELRTIVERALERRKYEGKATLLFIDEIHRFNKAQQDALLPHVENGTFTLIGATTENPSFAVNSAVLSRCRVFRLEPLDVAAVVALLRHAIGDRERGLGALELDASDEVLHAIARLSHGDARRALNTLEAAASLLDDKPGKNSKRIDLDLIRKVEGETPLLYDKAGEEHYNVTSALIKSMRGSDPDAAIYYLMRMVEAGDDPLFVLRRLLIFASEDVGNADPRALQLAVNADLAFRRLGMPEGLYAMAHACLYLASCPKSNAVGTAFTRAREAIRENGALPVPLKLRNAVTDLMSNAGYGAGYRYAHSEPEHYASGETYLPDALVGSRYYEPSDQGLEASIRERLARLRGAPKG